MSETETEALGQTERPPPDEQQRASSTQLERYGVFPRLPSGAGAAIFPRGLPTQGARRVEQVPLAEALTRRWDDDRHIVLYTASRPFRVNNAAVGKVRVEVRMLAFDVDNHEDVAGWMDVERPKIAALLSEHPGGFVHTTRRGWRGLYALPEPHPVRSETDKEAFARQYARVAAYLFARFGIVVDPALCVWNQPVRLPHVVREGRVFDAEILGGNPHEMGAFVLPKDVPAAPDLRELTRALPRWGAVARRWEPKRAVFRVAGAGFDGVPLPPYPERLAAAESWAREQAPRAVMGQGGRATARSVGAVLHVGFALERADVERILTGSYNRRRCAPPWAEDELGDLRGIARGVARDPVRPWGFMLTRDRTGIEAARATLAANAEAQRVVPLDQIPARIATAVEEHRAVVVRATYGAGKTHAMSRYIAAQTSGRVVVVVPRHELGRAWVEALGAAGERDVAYHASVVQRFDEQGNRHCDNRVALKLYKRGGDVARDVCPSCPRVASCPAYSTRPNMGARVHVLPREMLPLVGVTDEDLVVFDDAAVDLLTWHRLSVRQLRRLTAVDPRMLPSDQGRHVAALVEALLAGPRRAEELARAALEAAAGPDDALRALAARAAEGQRAPYVPPELLALEGDELAATLSDVRALRDVLRFAAACAAGGEVAWSADTRSVHGESPAAALVRCHGGRLVVLDAAANVEELRALRPDLHVERMDVVDAGPDTHRTLLFAEHATRSGLKDPAKRRSRSAVWLAGVLAHLTARRVRRPVIVTYKPLERELRDHPAIQSWLAEDERREVRFAHYGALRGSNRFQRADAVVTLGDPWLHGDDVVGRADRLDLDEPSYRIALATAELGQAHGRLRSVRRRRRLTHVHVGRLVPDGWGAGVEVKPIGGPPTRTRGAAERAEFAALVAVLGGNRQAAQVLGCASSAVAQWRVGTRALPVQVLEAARQASRSLEKITASSDVPAAGGCAAGMDTGACKDLLRGCVHESGCSRVSLCAGQGTEEAFVAPPQEAPSLPGERSIPPPGGVAGSARDERAPSLQPEQETRSLPEAPLPSPSPPSRAELVVARVEQVETAASDARARPPPQRQRVRVVRVGELAVQAAFVARALDALPGGDARARASPATPARASPEGFEPHELAAALDAVARAKRRFGIP